MKYKFNFSKKKMLSTLALFLAFLVFHFFVTSWFFPDSNWSIAKDNTISLIPDHSVIQKFVASQDGLSQIEVLFSKATGSGLKKGAEINMQIKDQSCSKTLGETSWGANALHSDNTYAFHFGKINRSKGKIYCFMITLKANGAAEKGIRVFTNATNPSPNSQYLFDGGTGTELKNQSLSMRPAYQNDTWWGNVRELDQRISQYKPWFLKSFYLYLIVFSFLAVTAVATVLLIII